MFWYVPLMEKLKNEEEGSASKVRKKRGKKP